MQNINYCRKCGSKLIDDAQFCNNCGSRVRIVSKDDDSLNSVGDIDDKSKQISSDRNVGEKTPTSDSPRGLLVMTFLLLAVLLVIVLVIVVFIFFMEKDKNKTIASDLTAQEYITDNQKVYDDTSSNVQDETELKNISEENSNKEEDADEGYLFEEENLDESDNTEAEAQEIKFIEPVKMHFHMEMYYEQTYVLDYDLEFEHDELGRITKVTNYDSNHNIENTVTQQYDTDGNCTREYSLGANTQGIYLRYYDNVWKDGGIVQSSSRTHKEVYENDSLGRHISGDDYDEQDQNYMHEDYSYDDQGRVSNIYRVNYGGGWSVNMVYHYDDDNEKPYLLERIYEDGDYSYDEYFYYYDGESLIQEVEKNYNVDGKLYYVITKEYEY